MKRSACGESLHASAPHSRPHCGAQRLLLGTSAQLAAVRVRIGKIARHDATVLIRGESGTGKELAASALHTASGRTGPFVALNCGALSDALIQSQLFGHARGAFTGAVAGHRGAFARADSGTLFLDEVGELPLASQALLLRVLETSTFTPLGAEHEVRTHARLVCATHRDLEHMVAHGHFRADLFHRLCVLEVHMPPLRTRPDDIALLARHFAAELGKRLGRTIELSPEALEAACGHDWPGNARQLRNAVLSAGLLSEHGRIDAQSLLPPGRLSRSPRSPRSPRSRSGDAICIPRGDYTSMRRSLLEQVVRESGSVRKAAKVLNVPRSTLGNWLRSKTG